MTTIYVPRQDGRADIYTYAGTVPWPQGASPSQVCATVSPSRQDVVAPAVAAHRVDPLDDILRSSKDELIGNGRELTCDLRASDPRIFALSFPESSWQRKRAKAALAKMLVTKDGKPLDVKPVHLSFDTALEFGFSDEIASENIIFRVGRPAQYALETLIGVRLMGGIIAWLADRKTPRALEALGPVSEFAHD